MRSFIVIAALCFGAGCFIGSVPGINEVTPNGSNGPPSLVGLSVSDSGGCVVASDGTLYCWGNNGHGLLGIPSKQRSYSPTPVAVKDLSGVTQAAAGSCAVKTDGSVWCWGIGGLRGDGSKADDTFPTPAPVAGVSGALAVSVGGYHACATHSNGQFSCWGPTSDFTVLTSQAQPMLPRAGAVVGLSNVVQGAAGGSHICAALADGTAMCWGINRFGQIGNGTSDEKISQKTPVAVSELNDTKQIVPSPQGEFTCALRRDGTVSCWGALQYLTGATNGGCHISTSPNFPCQTVPAPVPGLANVTQIAVTDGALCALLADRTVQCLGNGTLGDGSTDIRLTPGPVPGLADVVELAASSQNVCVRRADHAVLCWGMNASFGNDGQSIASNVPVEMKW